jgi:DNA-binding beta-propeller fold protein YncE
LTPIDAKTGKRGATIKVPDAYNLYFTPDGRSAIVVAEAKRQLEFRDPHTMKLQYTIRTPECYGLNHADFSLNGAYAFFTCEFGGGGLVKVDLMERRIASFIKLKAPSSAVTHNMPQDIRISPDGKLLFVADMEADGVFLIDAQDFKQVGFVPTGRGAHGLYPSRDGKKLYVSNRGGHMGETKSHGPGSVSVIDFATRRVETNWAIPGGGSPDMGNVSADGKFLWLSGRFDGVVYAIDTVNGAVRTIPVGAQPHGLTIWPQPGRYSLGHTGVMR